MTTNCQWCESKLEAYFSEDLGAEDRGLFQAHLASCEACSHQVKELREIDPLVQQVLHRRLAVARTAGQWNTRPRVWRAALAGSGIALAAVLGLGILALRPEAPEPFTAKNTPPVEAPAAIPVVDNPKDKVTAPPPIQRVKTDEGTTAPPAPQPELDKRPADGPDFEIIDASGSVFTLENYKGRVLLFGVVASDQKEATSNLQELYVAFGSNPKVRIFGVANSREDKFEGSTFPRWLNHASKLLGVQNGQFAIVDSTGSLKVKGSLANAADVARAGTQLEQLGVK
jgi:hypothetical protein